MVGLKKSGFSLIEVLVSIFVLAVSVIGAAGMHLAAMRTAQQSAFQTFAMQLAAEMADAMHASRERIRKAGLNPFVGIDYRSASDGEPQAPAKLCYSSECDAEELAEFEIYEWKKRVKSALPGGRVMVCRDSSPWDASKNALTWSCAGASDSNAPVVIKLGWQAKNPDGSLVRDADKLFPPGVALTVGL